MGLVLPLANALVCRRDRPALCAVNEAVGRSEQRAATVLLNLSEGDVEPHVEHELRNSTLELVFAYLDRVGLNWSEGD